MILHPELLPVMVICPWCGDTMPGDSYRYHHNRWCRSRTAYLRFRKACRMGTQEDIKRRLDDISTAASDRE